MKTKNDLFPQKKIKELNSANNPESIDNSNISDSSDILDISDKPLALRMRPVSLDEFLGQKHVLGPGRLLKRLIDADRLSSIILYGPSGTGKSALASIISKITQAGFMSVHAASANVKQVKNILEFAKKKKKFSQTKTILFVDEIHRFSKSQQDVFINDVELGNIILIGATTYNPFFYIIPALISRSHIFEFKPHAQDDLLCLLKRAIKDKPRGFGNLPIVYEEAALKHLCNMSDGDARRALNALELGILTTKPDHDGKINFTEIVAQESIQKKIVRYDRDGDDHYDVISAFIKSMRGTDPDAALHWLARMIYAGEDPRFIARRILICAAEDVGNADPQALVVANAAYQAAEVLGMPEARIPLAQATVYIACAPKSNAAYMGLEKATEDTQKQTQEEVPQHLKDASYKGAKELERGSGYEYAHDGKNHYVKQEYFKKNKQYYFPTDLGYEKKIKAWLKTLKQE